jgi:hypothetical protein
MFNLFKRSKPLATLTGNPSIFPGDREGDRGKIRMDLPLVFDNGDDVREFLIRNSLSTLILDRR